MLFGHVFQKWILFAYAKQAFPQYDKMEALIESFGDRPMMQTGKPLCGIIYAKITINFTRIYRNVLLRNVRFG